MLKDEDIRTIITVEVGDSGFAEMVDMAGIPSTGDSVEDLKAMAATMDVDVEDLLYALFVDEDEPLFNENTWTNLTTGDGSS